MADNSRQDADAWDQIEEMTIARRARLDGAAWRGPALSLEPGSCHVWWASPRDADPRLAALLDPDEQERWSALRRFPDRNRFLVACGLTRLALARYLGRSPIEIAIARTCARCGKPHGKPRLTPSSPGGLQFSISHAGDRVVVAFSCGAPLGVDVEELRPELVADELATLVLTPGEAEVLRSLDAAERTSAFFVYWTRKEAVAKAIGLGLEAPLQSFSVSGPHEPARLTAWDQDPELTRGISLHDLDPGPGYAASLAVIGRCRRITVQDGSALIGGSVGDQRAWQW